MESVLLAFIYKLNIYFLAYIKLVWAGPCARGGFWGLKPPPLGFSQIEFYLHYS